MASKNNMKEIGHLQKILTLAGVYNNNYARVNASVMKSLCGDDD